MLTVGHGLQRALRPAAGNNSVLHHSACEISVTCSASVVCRFVINTLLAWLAKTPPHLWPAYPSDPLGFSQIPGHCATQCRVVVIPGMVALTQNKIWVSLAHQPAPTHLQHPYEKRPKILKKTLAEHCSTQSSTGREWMPQGAGNGDPWRR
jgi:hypothetical protein